MSSAAAVMTAAVDATIAASVTTVARAVTRRAAQAVAATSTDTAEVAPRSLQRPQATVPWLKLSRARNAAASRTRAIESLGGGGICGYPGTGICGYPGAGICGYPGAGARGTLPASRPGD